MTEIIKSDLDTLRETAKNMGYRHWRNAGKDKLEAFILDNTSDEITQPNVDQKEKNVGIKESTCNCATKKESNLFSKALDWLGF